MLRTLKHLATDLHKKHNVFVTGASGYLGSHIIKLLLQNDFKVRTSVYDIKDKPDYEHLYNLIPEKREDIEIVEGKLDDKACWPSNIDSCKYVFHVASPVPGGVIEAGPEMIKVPVLGAENILEAALANGVKKVVMTASGVTSMMGSSKSVVTEETWGNETDCYDPYSKGKIKAERVAWNFYEKNKNRIQLSTVNPSLIVGPTLKPGSNTTGLMVTSSFLNGEFIGDTGQFFTYVDVRDVAETQYRAMFTEEANGRRYFSAADPVKMKEIINILNQEFGSLGYKVPDKKVTPQEILEQTQGIFAKTLFGFLATGNPILYNGRSVSELGMKYRSCRETFGDTAKSLIKHGMIPVKSKQK